MHQHTAKDQRQKTEDKKEQDASLQTPNVQRRRSVFALRVASLKLLGGQHLGDSIIEVVAVEHLGIIVLGILRPEIKCVLQVGKCIF